MVDAAMKHMASNFVNLDKFKGVDFRIWQKKMHFLLSNMRVVYVLTTPIPEDGENATVDQIKRRSKWENDDHVCRGLILNEAKYMAEDASSKKFTQHKMNMDEAILVSCIIDKLPPSWKGFKHTLKHHKEELTLVELDSHLHVKESLRVQDSDKPKHNNVAGPSVINMVEHNNSFMYNDNKGKRKHQDTKADPNNKSKVTCSKCGKPGHLKKDCKGGKVGNKANCSGINGSVNGSSNSLKAFISTTKLNDSILWHARLGHVSFKRIQDMSKDGLIPAFDMDTENDLCDLHATPLLWNKKYFVTFIDDTSKFCYVYLLHTNNEALDKFKVFKTEVELQQGSLIKRFRTDRGGLSQGFWGKAMLTACYLLNMVPNKRNNIAPHELWTKRKPNLNYLRVWGCKSVVRLPNPKLKTLGERGIECIFVGYAEHYKDFRFYVIEPNESVSINSIIKLMDAIFDENIFSSVLGLRTRDEKEAINEEMDSIIGNNTWVLDDLPRGCKPLGCKWIFKIKLKVNLTKEFLSSKFSMKDMGKDDVILSIRIKYKSNRIEISQSHYIEKGDWLPDKDTLMQARSTISIILKQTCITSSTMESEFVALATVGKETEWLRSPILEILLWPKPIAPISIRCDSAATLAKAFSQMYNGKSRHLGVRHNMIHELIINEVIYIEFVRSQQNLADHLTKGLARDLVLKSTEGMGLNSKLVTKC
ncbi:zinc finger, CCHC-type containing protein [Tanacetum coccineum]